MILLLPGRGLGPFEFVMQMPHLGGYLCVCRDRNRLFTPSGSASSHTLKIFGRRRSAGDPVTVGEKIGRDDPV